MVVEIADIHTYKSLHPLDSNEFVMVGDNDVPISKNFKEYEFYNNLVGLKQHPFSTNTIKLVQFIRDYYGYPIIVERRGKSIGRTYRNYKSVTGSSDSAHMRGEGVDFNFAVSKDIQDELILLIREDILKKGPLFQALRKFGCTGFGIYDTFLHLDTVPIELYESFRIKRRRTHEGSYYGYWDKTKKLNLLKPKGVLTSTGEINSNPPEVNVITQAKDEAKKAAGAALGFLKEFTMIEVEDQGKDINRVNIGYLIAFVIGLFLMLLLSIGLIKKIIR